MTMFSPGQATDWFAVLVLHHEIGSFVEGGGRIGRTTAMVPALGDYWLTGYIGGPASRCLKYVPGEQEHE